MEEDAKAVKIAMGERKLDAVITAAGGWAGGNISCAPFTPFSFTFFVYFFILITVSISTAASIFESSDRMIRFNVNSSLVASHVAASHLKEVHLCLSESPKGSFISL